MKTSVVFRTLAACLALLWLASTAQAAEYSYRFFRFTPVKLRTTAATSIQMSEFEMQFNSARIGGALITNPGGNNPAAEQPANVYDGQTTTKWLDRNKGPIIMDFGGEVTVTGYRFATANDREERDPVSWTMEGSNDGAAWTVLDTKTDYPVPLTRFSYTPEFLFTSEVPPVVSVFKASPAVILPGGNTTLSWTTISATSVSISPAVGGVALNGSVVVTPAASTTYTVTATNDFGTHSLQFPVLVRTQRAVTYRFFRFLTTKQRGGPQALQLAEFQLLKDGTPYTGATATNPGGNSPVLEEVFRVVDGDVNTKWLDQNHGALILDYGVGIEANAYRFVTANDSAARDPVSWDMYGSDDGVNWILLDKVEDFPVPEQRFTATDAIPFPNTEFPPAISSFTASVQMVVPGQPVSLSWTALGATSATLTGVGPVDPVSDSATVHPTTTTTYTLTVSNSAGEDTATVTIGAGFVGGVSYRYFRFTPTKLRDGVLANSVQLAEFGMFLGSTRVPGATATNPGGDNPATEMPANAVDGDLGTKWLDFNKAPLVLDYGAPVSVDGYNFATANDSIERDPVSWTLEGSLDGVAWTLIDAKGDYATPFDRDTYLPFPAPTLASTPAPPGEFKFTAFELTNNQQYVRIRVNTAPGITYTLQRATDLTVGGTGDWQEAAPPFSTQDTQVEFVIPTGGVPNSYYRVIR